MRRMVLLAVCASALAACAGLHDLDHSIAQSINAAGTPQAPRQRVSDDPCLQVWAAALMMPAATSGEGYANATRAKLICQGYAVPPPSPPIVVAPAYPQQTICEPYGRGVICNSQ